MTRGLPDKIGDLLQEFGMERVRSSGATVQTATDDKLDALVTEYQKLYRNEDGDVLIGGARSGVTLWPDQTSAIDPTALISRWALWADAVYVADPFLEVGPRKFYLALDNSRGWRDAIEDALVKLHSLLALARLGYVELTGLPLMRRGTPGMLFMDRASEDFDDSLAQIALDNLRVMPGVGKSDSGILLGADTSVQMPPPSTDVLFFEFEGDRGGEMFAYARIIGLDDETRKVMTHARLAGESIPQDEFTKWYRQSVVKVIRKRFDDLAFELATATTFGGTFATTSRTNMKLAIAMDYEIQREATTEGVARLLLPALHEISLEDVIRMRSDSQALSELRDLVRRVAANYRGDPGSITEADVITAQRQMDEEIVPSIKAEIRRSRKALIKNAVLLPVVTVLGQIASGWQAAAIAGATSLIGTAMNASDTLRVAGKRGVALYSQLLSSQTEGVTAPSDRTQSSVPGITIRGMDAIIPSSPKE